MFPVIISRRILPTAFAQTVFDIYRSDVPNKNVTDRKRNKKDC